MSASSLSVRQQPRALSSLGGGKGYGRGAEGVGPSHRKEGNGELGKGFGAKAITYWTAGEAAEEGRAAAQRDCRAPSAAAATAR